MSVAARARAPALFGTLRRLGTSAAEAERERGARWELSAAREYYDYRKSIYGDVTHRALLVDAVGTLVVPAQPTAQVYKSIGEKYGVKYSEDEILMGYRWAYGQPWGRSRLSNTILWEIILRYVDDGRPFWQHIVSSSTGCSDLEYFEELYQYYMTEKAWKLCDPDAEHVFDALRKAGVKTAVVSNFDTRLRPLLQALKCDHWFDAVAVSAEVEVEKPNPTIFLKACELLDVKPEEAVHVGDDRRNDVWGARDAGCDAWLWGSDVHSFKEGCMGRTTGRCCKLEQMLFNRMRWLMRRLWMWPLFLSWDCLQFLEIVVMKLRNWKGGGRKEGKLEDKKGLAT